MTPPRSIFRARARRRRGLGAEDYAPQVIAAARKLTPGTAAVAEVRHEPECRRPRGGACTCPPGRIDVRLRPLHDPGRN